MIPIYSKEKLAELLGQVDYREHATPFQIRTAHLIIEHDLYESMMDIALEYNNKVGFRAAWSVEKVFELQKEKLYIYGNRLMDDFPRITNESVKRHYCKLILWLLQGQRVSDLYADQIAETVCNWLIAPHTKVAVKVHGMEILKCLSGKVIWVPEVLSDILCRESLSPTPGIASRIRKLQKSEY